MSEQIDRFRQIRPQTDRRFDAVIPTNLIEDAIVSKPHDSDHSQNFPIYSPPLFAHQSQTHTLSDLIA